MMRRILVVSFLVLLTPAGAHAATLAKSGSTLTFTAQSGAKNVVTFSETAPGTVDVQRNTLAGDDDPIATAAGCQTISPGSHYVCPGPGDGVGVTTVAADGKDGDDVLDASGLTAAHAALAGGAGDDTLSGGAGADSLSGGPGIDVADVSGTPVDVSLDDVADDGRPGEGDNVHSDVEDVVADPGAGGSATLTGSDAGNSLRVISGRGAITGGAGFDLLAGSAGDDTIDARDGFGDRVSCGAGVDAVKADQFDQIASDCENVDTQPVIGGADDRPPAVSWSSPASGAALAAEPATTLAVAASDDHGVARVEFYDDDRLVCTDAAAPYTCAYAPRGGDVGRDTLIARAVDTAGQSTSAVQAITVRRFSARRLTLALSPARDARAPYRFNLFGALSLPAVVAPSQGCAGAEVDIAAKVGSKTVAARRATLTRQCEYRLRITFAHRPGARVRFTARFAGNDVMAPKSAPRRTGRTR
jgi:Bacterial Ig domain/RTX calcium-binding nonapeptide repeat (4 copies)